MTEPIDLQVLRDRVRATFPSLSCELIELEHSATRDRHPALSIETQERKKGHVYRMGIAVIDGKVNFFVHTFGESADLTTRGAQCFSKECSGIDEVFAMVLRCWGGGQPS